MSIRFQCHKCSVAIKAPQSRGGAQLPCPKCGTMLVIPVSQGTPAEEASTQSEAAQFANLAAQLEGSSESSTLPQAEAPPMPPARESAQASGAPAAPSAPAPPQQAPPAVSYESVGKGQVRIVDIKLPFASVLRLGLQFWAVGLLASVVLWIFVAMVTIILGALGVGLSLFGA